MDHDQIKERMAALALAYASMEFPKIENHKHGYQLALAIQKRRQREFYAEMNYLEEMLELTPRSTSAATKAVIEPYKPRGRGRPPTGGRKPRDRRVNKDDDSW